MMAIIFIIKMIMMTIMIMKMMITSNQSSVDDMAAVARGDAQTR